MYILTLTGKPDHVFTLTGADYEQVVPMFSDIEDAERYVYLIDESRDPMAPELDVVEVPGDDIIEACESHGHNYVVFDEDDLLIPPRNL
jgi:hypothetical protein